MGDSFDSDGRAHCEWHDPSDLALPLQNQEITFHHLLADFHSKRKQTRSRRLKMTDLGTIQAANTVDARGSACPGPLLEAKKGIGKVKVGEVLEVLSGDPGTRSDIPAWAGKVGHEFLGVLQADGYDRLFVRRKK
jgi:tRNA 2-thiouridine synthesizing protein A